MIYAAILAGGVGSRFNGSKGMPKQFYSIKGTPILLKSIQSFLNNALVDKIYIGVPKDWQELTEELLAKNDLADKVVITIGGSTRLSTLTNVIKKIESENAITEECLILTHDAARPFLTQRIIDENIKVAKEFGACTTAVKTADTILISLDGKTVLKTLKREHMYNIQTPQTFNFKLLKKVIGSLTSQEKEGLTDLSGAFVLKGVPIRLVKGEEKNFKITTQDDLFLLNM